MPISEVGVAGDDAFSRTGTLSSSHEYAGLYLPGCLFSTVICINISLPTIMRKTHATEHHRRSLHHGSAQIAICDAHTSLTSEYYIDTT